VTKKNKKQPSGLSLGRKTVNTSLCGPRLQEALETGLSEDELYSNFMKNDIWSIEEFACLMTGVAPQIFKKICAKDESLTSEEENTKASNVIKMQQKLIRRAKKNPQEEFPLIGAPFMSPWKFIKWLAATKLRVRVGFIRKLPLYLLENYAFHARSNHLGKKSKFSREYHRALYLRYAKHLLQHAPTRMTYKEIYEHPFMLNLLRSFKHHDGTAANYRKSTIIKSWLPRLEKRCR
jgi:hypothetical protein